MKPVLLLLLAGLPSCSGGSSAAEVVVDLALVDFTNGRWEVTGRQPTVSYDWAGSRLFFTSQVPTGDGWTLEGYMEWQLNTGFSGIATGREFFTGTLLAADRSLVLTGGQRYENLQTPGSFVFCGGVFAAVVAANGRQLRRGTWEDEISLAPSSPIVGVCAPGEWSADLVPGTVPVRLPAPAGQRVLLLRSDGVTDHVLPGTLRSR